MPDFVVCTLPPETLTDTQIWYLKHGDRYDIKALSLEGQFELSAIIEEMVRDFREEMAEQPDWQERRAREASNE